MTAATAERTLGQAGTQAMALRRLELTVARRLDGALHGEHDGRLPGPGWDTGDGRPYQPGDDVRRIDWSLSARSNATQVRDTIAERELETWFVVDGSASLDFGTAEREKRDLALAAVAAFGFLSATGADRVGALVAGPGGDDVVPPRPGRLAVHGLLRTLHGRPASPPGGHVLGDALRRTARLARRRGRVVVVTDLLEPLDSWAPPLRVLATRHDVVVVELADPREDALPAVGLLTVVDPETGRLREVQTSDARLRARFAGAARERRAAVAAAVRGAGAAHVLLSTERDWLPDVVRHVQRSRRRR